MKTWLEIAKTNLPEEFWPVIDAYARSLELMPAEQLVAWCGLVIQHKTRKALDRIRWTATITELAAMIEAEHTLAEALNRKYHKRRESTAAFWRGMAQAALVLLSAWLSAQTGVPMVVGEK